MRIVELVGLYMPSSVSRRGLRAINAFRCRFACEVEEIVEDDDDVDVDVHVDVDLGFPSGIGSSAGRFTVGLAVT